MCLCLSLATAATWCGRARCCTCTSLPTAWSRSKSSQHQRPSEIASSPPSAKRLWMPPPKSGGPLQFDLCCVQRCSSVLWSVSLTALFFLLNKLFYRKHGQTVLRRFATYKGFRTFLTNIPEKDRIHLEKIMRKAKWIVRELKDQQMLILIKVQRSLFGKVVQGNTWKNQLVKPRHYTRFIYTDCFTWIFQSSLSLNSPVVRKFHYSRLEPSPKCLWKQLILEISPPWCHNGNGSRLFLPLRLPCSHCFLVTPPKKTWEVQHPCCFTVLYLFYIRLNVFFSPKISKKKSALEMGIT